MPTLRAVADQLFSHLKATDRGRLEIEEDYYWFINSDEAYAPLKDPSELTLGQLEEDCRELSSILASENPPIGYALVWLSSILRRVGEKTVH